MAEPRCAAAHPPSSDLAPAKIARRILPFLFVLYVMSYLDRTNVAFARVPMNAELGFTEATYGLGTGLFFIGYFFLGIPGALIVERWGARRLIGFTAIAWGVATCLFASVKSPAQFYAFRLLLGLSAAPFFPGVIVYLSNWFPERDRSRALAAFMIAAPISLTLGGPLSALILGTHWVWFSGWQWIFILEGLPTICLGMVAFFVLKDSAKQAQWLVGSERGLPRSAPITVAPPKPWWKVLCERNVILLCGAHAFANIAGYGFIFWLPSTVKNAIGSTAGSSAAMADAITAIPFGLSVLAMWLAARSSDRRGERKLHACLPMLCAAFLYTLTLVRGQPSALVLVWICLTGACVFAWVPGFWALPTTISTGPARAASIGLINAIGNLGGFLGPAIIGQLLTRTRSGTALVILVALSYCAAAGLTSLVRPKPRQWLAPS